MVVLIAAKIQQIGNTPKKKRRFFHAWFKFRGALLGGSCWELTVS
jgi:hypothetical protein